MSYPDEPSDSLPYRLWPGLPLFLLGSCLAFVLMANDRSTSFGVPLGAVACFVATLGLLDVFGSFTATRAMSVTEASPRLSPWFLGFVLGLGGFIWTTRAAVAGNLPGGSALAGVLLPLLLGFAIVALYGVVHALGVFPQGTRLHQHPSLWLLLVTVLVYLPRLGAFSLIDPWETHYGEVAREILARDEWFSLWWAQDGWFWSKPILDFWLQALSFSLFGVQHAPDAMLAAAARGFEPHPEWAARLPMLLLSLLGQVLLYAAAAKAWGKRPALLGSLLLVSVPYYALIVHQSMTDLPYIATLMAAMGLFLLGLFTPDDQTVRGFALPLGKRQLILSAHQLVIGSIVLLALPQVLYLCSRNLGLVTSGSDLGFYLHPDRFFSGSGGGNCGLPGNVECHLKRAVSSRPAPALSALFWAALQLVLLVATRHERRAKRLLYLGAWLFVALSAMAKGLPGPVLFVGSVGAALLILGKVNEGFKLELPTALLVLAVVALPWFVQCTVRHGNAFLERLFIHDMYKRAFEHVHDTNAGDDVSLRYYLWQLGYGLFPATGIVALGAVGALAGRVERRLASSALTLYLALYCLVGFGMFTLTLTKFHHYIIPIVPALCLLAGPVLDRAIGPHFRLPGNQTPNSRLPVNFLLVGLASALIVVFAGIDLFGPAKPPGGAARLINLVTYAYTRIWPDTLDFASVLFAFTLAAVASLLGLLGPARVRAAAAVTHVGVCLLFGAWVCNSYLPAVAPHWGQRETVLEYYRRRKGPEEPLVAYQMNWKGENFYSGNRLPVFIATGDRFKAWVTEQRDRGTVVLYFTLEHSRLGGLKNELGPVQRLEVVTTKALNNKFALARVQL